MANTETLKALNAAAIQTAQEEAFVKPEITSPDQVLFKTTKHQLGSATEGGIRFTFKNKYLLTSDATIISFIRKNTELWGITEER